MVNGAREENSHDIRGRDRRCQVEWGKEEHEEPAEPVH